MGALSILIGVVTYANRSTPGVVGAYVIGVLILFSVTMKHKFVDHVNVPIPAMVIQVVILFAVVYLWIQRKKV